jgi:hypothetical protein
MEKFMDKVKKGIDKGVTIVGVKSKEIMEAGKIESQIRDLEERKHLALEEAGMIVYKMFIQSDYDGEEELKGKCEGIYDLDQQIEAKQAELKKVHLEAQTALGKTVCACGAAMEDGIKFCSNCGAKLE